MGSYRGDEQSQISDLEDRLGRVERRVDEVASRRRVLFDWKWDGETAAGWALGSIALVAVACVVGLLVYMEYMVTTSSTVPIGCYVESHPDTRHPERVTLTADVPWGMDHEMGVYDTPERAFVVALQARCPIEGPGR